MAVPSSSPRCPYLDEARHSLTERGLAERRAVHVALLRLLFELSDASHVDLRPDDLAGVSLDDAPANRELIDDPHPASTLGPWLSLHDSWLAGGVVLDFDAKSPGCPVQPQQDGLPASSANAVADNLGDDKRGVITRCREPDSMAEGLHNPARRSHRLGGYGPAELRGIARKGLPTQMRAAGTDQGLGHNTPALVCGASKGQGRDGSCASALL